MLISCLSVNSAFVYGLSILAKEQLLTSKHVSDAIKKYKIDTDKPMPTKL